MSVSRSIPDVALALLLSSLFTAVIVQYSFRHGRLLGPPLYDDVTYFNDGLQRLDMAEREGLVSVVRSHIQDPPHSPFATYLAAASFAVFGFHDWAPYAGNFVIVLTLVGFVGYLLREAPRWIRVVIQAFALTVPLAGVSVFDFKPDMACALVTAMGCVLALEKSLFTGPGRGRSIAVGSCFGLALLIKPSIFALTVILLVSSVLLALACDRHETTDASARAAMTPSIALCLATAVLLAAPHFVASGRHYVDYIRSSILASDKPIPDYAGSVADKASYYVTGTGGRQMLGGHLYLCAALLLFLGARSARANADVGRRLASLGIVGIVAYLIPTLNPVKQPYFGLAFQEIVVLLGIVALASSLRAGGKAGRDARWMVLPLFAGGLALASWPSFWGDWSGTRLSTLGRIVTGIGTTLETEKAPEGSRIFLTTSGNITPDVISYEALKRGHHYRVWSDYMDDDLGRYGRSFDASDFVIAAEPGNGENGPNLPSARILAQTLALVRARPDFDELASFPTDTGRSYIVFARKTMGCCGRSSDVSDDKMAGRFRE